MTTASTKVSHDVERDDSYAATQALAWWSDFATDFTRYRAHRPHVPVFVIMATEQGLWALLTYRAARGIRRSGMPRALKSVLLFLASVAQKVVEIVTGITLPSRARIGAGLYIGHSGNVILHEDVVIGHTCNISQGVTIGSSGRGQKRGVPCLGNRVYVATNAVIVGDITVGDDSAVAANSLVTRDVEASTTVMGVPAKIVSRKGSEGYI